MSSVQLQIHNVSLSFGGLKVLRNVSLGVRKGHLHAIIGPNGAGKSSILNCICGLYKFQSGDILYEGKPISNLKPYKIAELGIGRVFQNIELFKHMTVIDNLLLGRHRLMNTGVLASALYFGKSKREEIRHREKVEEIIEFLEIENFRTHPVGSLSYGVQKKVELGRALAGEPHTLLLDEPIAGMNVEEKEDMARFLNEIRVELGLTMVLIEHDMSFVMDLADRVSVLDFGELVAEGTPEEVQTNPEVIKAYLGVSQQSTAQDGKEALANALSQ